MPDPEVLVGAAVAVVVAVGVTEDYVDRQSYLHMGKLRRLCSYRNTEPGQVSVGEYINRMADAATQECLYTICY